MIRSPRFCDWAKSVAPRLLLYLFFSRIFASPRPSSFTLLHHHHRTRLHLLAVNSTALSAQLEARSIVRCARRRRRAAAAGGSCHTLGSGGIDHRSPPPPLMLRAVASASLRLASPSPRCRRVAVRAMVSCAPCLISGYRGCSIVHAERRPGSHTERPHLRSARSGPQQSSLAAKMKSR